MLELGLHRADQGHVACELTLSELFTGSAKWCAVLSPRREKGVGWCERGGAIVSSWLCVCFGVG